MFAGSVKQGPDPDPHQSRRCLSFLLTLVTASTAALEMKKPLAHTPRNYLVLLCLIQSPLTLCSYPLQPLLSI